MQRASALFGIDELKRLGGFENLLFRSSEPPGRVLRLTHTSRRSVDVMEAELEFMAHLSASGVQAVAPIRSGAGRFVEELRSEAGTDVLVVCMTEAPGNYMRSGVWPDSQIVGYGELMGSLHVAAGTFAAGESRRPPWTDPIFDVGLPAAEVADPRLHARNLEVRAKAAGHAAGATGLLIHQDAHTGNILVSHDGALCLVDFDDAAYGTATHDVAIALCFWLMGFVGDQIAEARRFVPLFMSGYDRHARLPADWPDGADRFMSLRELELLWLIEKLSADDRSPTEERFMVGRRARVLEGIPYLGAPLAEIL